LAIGHWLLTVGWKECLMSDAPNLQHIRWDDVPEETVNPLSTRRVLHTPAMTIVQLAYKRGAIVPLHHHVHEQVTTVTAGSMRIDVDGRPVVLKAGESLCVPSDAPHQAEALEDARATEVFVPARTDWATLSR
jgi:quercetin dioxygenase-like cupin family protein